MDELLAWCHDQLIYGQYEVSQLLEDGKWEDVPPGSVNEFLHRVPHKACSLPYYILCHGVAYATFAHMPCQANYDVVFAFMHDYKAHASPYTLWYMLSMRGLSKYIVRLVEEDVHTISDVFDICVDGKYPSLLERIGVHEGTDDHARFVSLGDVLRLILATGRAISKLRSFFIMSISTAN